MVLDVRKDFPPIYATDSDVYLWRGKLCAEIRKFLRVLLFDIVGRYYYTLYARMEFYGTMLICSQIVRLYEFV